MHSMMRQQELIRENTTVSCAEGIPEIRLHLSDDLKGLADKVGRFPYWAKVWPSGKDLARIILDHPWLVRGLRVLDVGSGSGIAAIAAVKAGAFSVSASEIDPTALAAIEMNARLNNVYIGCIDGDITHTSISVDMILCADFTYREVLADRIIPFVQRSDARCLIIDTRRGSGINIEY